MSRRECTACEGRGGTTAGNRGEVIWDCDECDGRGWVSDSPKLIALTGPVGSGKSTVALHLVKHHDFARVRFAGKVKAMLRALGLSEAQVDGEEKDKPCALLGGKTPRHAMQTIGDWGRESIGKEIWCNAAMLDVANLLTKGRDVVIDDCRFDNEAQAIVDCGGSIVSLFRKGAGIEGDHASERGISSHYITLLAANNCAVDLTARSVLGGLELFEDPSSQPAIVVPLTPNT